MQLIRISCFAILRKALEIHLEVGQRSRIDELAQLFLPEQLGQDAAIQGKRLRPPLRERCVAFVDERTDVPERQRACERRRDRRLDLHEEDLAPADRRHQVHERRQVEHVLQALAERLEHNGERAVLRRNGHQVARTLPLLPQRRALSGPPARDQQRAHRALAEPAGEERRVPDRSDDDIFDLFRLEHEHVGPERLVGLRQPDDDPVV